jgi:RNA polymerase sigma-70 factor (ECF subfamily)
MNETSWAGLRALLVEQYEAFGRRLARRLGSGDLATEVLHDTWLRLQRAGPAAAVERPESYLYRVALNVAQDRRERDRRQLPISDVEDLRHHDDDHPDPERIAAARSEIALLTVALEELPERCREIFLAVRLDEQTHQEVAASFDISVRTVEREVRRAVEHCICRLGGAGDGTRP